MKYQPSPRWGFTFTELIIAFFCVVVIATITAAAYLGFTRYTDVQRAKLELQQEARQAMFAMGDISLSDINRLVLTERVGCSDSSMITFQIPLHDTQTLPDGSTLETTQINYDVNPPQIHWDPVFVNYSYDCSTQGLLKTAGSSTRVLARHVSSLGFSTAEDGKAIRVDLMLQKEAFPGRSMSFSLNSIIGLHNYISLDSCSPGNHGDGVCCTGEDSLSSPEDCPVLVTCGTGDYNCSIAANCNSCSSCWPCCGNHICDRSYESCSSCPGDCGGCPPPPCFLAGTTVLMADDSLKAIEDVKVGDMIKSFDDKENIFNSQVTQVLVHPDTKGYLLVETSDGQPLQVTPEHMVYSAGEYKPIGTLTIGSPLSLAKDGRLMTTEITAMRKIDTTQATYNLEVEGSHTYFANRYAVHNSKGPVIIISPPG